MPRSLTINPTIPIEVQRHLRTLTQWAQQDDERLSTTVPQSTAAIGSKLADQKQIVQMLAATSAQIVATAPASHAAPGRAGQIATDAAGNLYFCYAPNSWARLGSGGYSNSF